MEATIVKQPAIYQLTLSEEEAAWLACLMQNPLANQEGRPEEAVDRQHREALFTALDTAYRNR